MKDSSVMGQKKKRRTKRIIYDEGLNTTMVCTGTEGFALAGPLVEPHGFEVMGVGLGAGVLVTRVAGVHLIRHHGLVLASLGRRGSLYADGRNLQQGQC